MKEKNCTQVGSQKCEHSHTQILQPLFDNCQLGIFDIISWVYVWCKYSYKFYYFTKGIVERNSHSKAESCISQKGNVKILFSDISDFGLQEM